jgi:hypothetical protein
MPDAQLPDMNSGIISFWFRDATGKAGVAPPPPKEFPSGLWAPGTESMVPPWVAQAVQNMDGSPIFYWDAYGVPNRFFGSFITGAAAVNIPTPPFFPTDSIRMLLSFGKPDQRYDYRPWQLEDGNVIDAVKYLSSQGFVITGSDAPYLLYDHTVGDGGKFHVKNFRIGAPVNKPDFVPQSFIGVDKDGYLIICLQTDTRASYRGMAYMLDKITELWASRTELIVDGPPYKYTQIGFPFPDGHWESYPGFWNGYQFEYKDISNEVMGVQPETFVIGGPQVSFEPGGPRVDGDTWHHVLFSFDISGSVSVDHPENLNLSKATASSACRAWLAVDDKNYSDYALQRRLRIPNGVDAPLLPGVGHDIFPYGPTISFYRSDLNLGSNDIIPQNAFLRALFMSPRSGLPRFAANAPILEEANAFTPAGDFDPLSGWTGAIWPLYGNGVAPGPWLAVLDPPRPTVPDPATFDLPGYSCSRFNIPVKGYPIGIPASQHHLAHNTGVEMAELQIWANNTLDTSNTSMRRLFIDENGSPVSPAVAANVLGRPDVLLHGSENWKAGRNTGAVGLDDSDNINPSGQFEPIAKIETFLPDPKLGA